MNMNDIYHLDKARVQRSFNRAARDYDAAAVLQKKVREEMLSRLDLVKLKPQTILDAGCGTGHGGLSLSKKFKAARVVALDVAPVMLQVAQANQSLLQRYLKPLQPICADIEQLPLAGNSVELAWSNLAIQWCNDLDAAFTEFHRVLKPEGLLMFSTFGPDTLRELRLASSQDNTTSVSRFIDMHDIGDALVRAGFSAPVLDVERYTLTYDTVMDVMRDLKAIGAHNATDGRSRGLQGRGFLQKLAENYEQFRSDNKLPATFEVVFGHAWKGKMRDKTKVDDGYAPINFVPKTIKK